MIQPHPLFRCADALKLDAEPTITGKPGPALPCLMGGWPARPVSYPDLPALARAIHRLRTAGGRERSLQLIATTATWEGSDSFPAFKILVGEPGEAPVDYLASCYALGRRRDALAAIIAAENPGATPPGPQHSRALRHDRCPGRRAA